MKRLSITVGAVALTVGLATPAVADRDAENFGQGTAFEQGTAFGQATAVGQGTGLGQATAFGQATLTGFASLPAETFVPNSEPSGSAIGAGPFNGITGPFADQPVQGFSGAVNRHDGSYDVLSDNGYGSQANSADFLLRVHRVKPDTKTGKVKVLGGFNLSDPHHKVPFPLTRTDRVLTGADFDVESIVRAYDGSYWLGDEFGPFLLHFSSTGKLLEAPISLDGVRAPENPYLNGAQPTTGSSKGFEGMVRAVDGRHLYPLLEGTVNGDTPGDLRFSEFDLKAREYTGKRFTYRLESPSNAIGDAIAVDKNRFLVIERDGGQGADAKFKRIYLADTRDRNGDGVMDKTLVADLMNIANPKGLGGFGATFTFPFTTIEDVVLLDSRTLAVLNDNNFPFSSGRTPGKADNNEFITIKLTESLKADKRALK